MNVDERLAILVPILSALLCSASQDNDTLPSLLPKTKGAEAAPAPAPAPELRVKEPPPLPPAPHSCEFICFSSSGIMRPTCDARRRVDPPVACFRSLLPWRLAFGEERAEEEDAEPGVGSGNMILSAKVCPATTGDIASLALPCELDPPAPIVCVRPYDLCTVGVTEERTLAFYYL